MFPEVVKAISQAYLVTRNPCPYAEILVITNQSQIVDAEECPPLESTELNSVDWATEQSKYITLSRVIYLLIYLLKSGYNPQNTYLQNEDINVSKHLKDWKKLSFKNNILYRTTMIDGQQITQLVLPVHFRRAVGIINFERLSPNFIADTMNWFLNSMLD